MQNNALKLLLYVGLARLKKRGALLFPKSVLKSPNQRKRPRPAKEVGAFFAGRTSSENEKENMVRPEDGAVARSIRSNELVQLFLRS